MGARELYITYALEDKPVGIDLPVFGAAIRMVRQLIGICLRA